MDDQYVARSFFELHVEMTKRYELVASLPNAEQAVAWCAEHPVDLVIICNMENASNNTTLRLNWNVAFGLGDDAPWFVSEVPALMISTAYPYHLFDAPMLKTYINAYAGTPDYQRAVMDKLMGRSAFTGKSPVDPFCGREELTL
ncbi:MAG: hypothetical protein IKD61_09110 [Oscillospiraceae bacterium]|nr:hypothetical protein [Oscillospiraceae bacterium]